jgi:hypothetical protein
MPMRGRLDAAKKARTSAAELPDRQVIETKAAARSKNGAPPNEGEMTGQLMLHPRHDLSLILLGTIGKAPALFLLSIHQGSTSGLKHTPTSLSAVVVCEKVPHYFAKHNTLTNDNLWASVLILLVVYCLYTRRPGASQPAAMMRRPHRRCILSNAVVVVGGPIVEKMTM